MSTCAECGIETEIRPQCDGCLDKLNPSEDEARACHKHIEDFAIMKGMKIKDMSSELLNALAKEFYGI